MNGLSDLEKKHHVEGLPYHKPPNPRRRYDIYFKSVRSLVGYQMLELGKLFLVFMFLYWVVGFLPFAR